MAARATHGSGCPLLHVQRSSPRSPALSTPKYTRTHTLTLTFACAFAHSPICSSSALQSFAVAMAKVADDTKVQDLVVLNVVSFRMHMTNHMCVYARIRNIPVHVCI